MNSETFVKLMTQIGVIVMKRLIENVHPLKAHLCVKLIGVGPCPWCTEKLQLIAKSAEWMLNGTSRAAVVHTQVPAIKARHQLNALAITTVPPTCLCKALPQVPISVRDRIIVDTS